MHRPHVAYGLPRGVVSVEKVVGRYYVGRAEVDAELMGELSGYARLATSGRIRREGMVAGMLRGERHSCHEACDKAYASAEYSRPVCLSFHLFWFNDVPILLFAAL